LYADTFILLEQLGHALDRENERLFEIHKKSGLTGLELSGAIARDLDVSNILKRCAPIWDGGYAICGIVGNGDMWCMRDPNGIRPVFYYVDDEVVVIASERPVIQTAFNLEVNDVKELTPGNAIIVDRDGSVRLDKILNQIDNKQCSFERIYFSRGSDYDIYRERKNLGRQLVKPILEAIDYDLDNTVFSFVPNTAEVAFIGMIDGFEKYLNKEKIVEIEQLSANGELTEEKTELILNKRIRREKIALKDIKLRTFIAEGASRDDLAAHVYDITYGSIVPHKDSVVVIDDSIVRGTTLRQSIIRILNRLNPRKIVIVSSSPQVRYPDCYGIDMSRMNEFIAFRAAIELLHETGRDSVIHEVYDKCKLQENLPKEQIYNYVKDIYAPFTDEEISDKIAEMLTPPGTSADVKIVYQSLGGMHKAIPNHKGDWYFSGDYPTPGGNRLVNKAFINYYEGNANKRD
jgi:amidophosphoribosyltransferase